jgi:hypothetical protein
MTSQPQPVEVTALQAEHEALKEQTAALRREDNRLRAEGRHERRVPANTAATSQRKSKTSNNTSPG